MPSIQVNWREIPAARNTGAVLSAACGKSGFRLVPTSSPRDDVTCYSLNSINARLYRDEIAAAECVTIVGGPHATAFPRETAAYADYVIAGEGEYTLVRLLSEIAEGRDGKIPGVATADFFSPADTSVLLDAYPPFGERQGYIEISRGCPHDCGYCQTPGIFGHCMRHRSIDAIARAARRYRDARFVSPNAFAYGSDGRHPRFDKVGHLLRKLDGRIWFGTFPAEVRPEFVCDQSLSLLSDYCSNTRLHFGAQSGSDAVLRKLRRGHTVDDVIRAVEACSSYGITPVVDFIIGIPFETDEDQRQTLDLIRWVARTGKVHLHRFLPLPGTRLGSASARSLLKETQEICGKLAFSGRLTGSWDDPEIRFFRRPSNDIP